MKLDRDVKEAIAIVSSTEPHGGLSIPQAQKVTELLHELQELRDATRKALGDPDSRPKRKAAAWWTRPENLVESSNVRAARFVPQAAGAGVTGGKRGHLEVAFKGGTAVYRYLDVPADVWREFRAAESKGKFLNARIKKTFEFEKVEAEEDPGAGREA